MVCQILFLSAIEVGFGGCVVDQALEERDTTKAQLGAESRDGINGVKHKMCKFLRKRSQSA